MCIGAYLAGVCEVTTLDLGDELSRILRQMHVAPEPELARGAAVHGKGIFPLLFRLIITDDYFSLL